MTMGRSGWLGRLGRRIVGMRRRARGEDGSATIEFVLIFPVFMVLFISTFESGMLLTRHVMLDRGVDLAVRSVRLGTLDPVNHDSLKALICENAAIIPDCITQLRLEMRPLDPRAWSNIPNGIDCVDREDDSKALREFRSGVSNQLMVLRACALFDPFFPTTGLGSSLPRQSGGAYALVTTASFVIEPNT